MDEHAKLRSLLDLAESIGVVIRSAPPADDGSAGALVRLKGREMLFLDTSSSPADQIDVVASALRGRDEIDRMYLQPGIRDIIDGGDL